MRFVLDMGLARSTAEFLRHQGHDAIHLRDQELQRLSDEKIAAKVNRRLEDVLERFAALLEEGALISVTDEAVRVRRLPVGR